MVLKIRDIRPKRWGIWWKGFMEKVSSESGGTEMEWCIVKRWWWCDDELVRERWDDSSMDSSSTWTWCTNATASLITCDFVVVLPSAVYRTLSVRSHVVLYRAGWITCSTVVLQCYRRQAIPMQQGEIRPFLTLYSLNRSLSNLVWLMMSATSTHMPILVEFGWVGNSPLIGEI